MHITPTSPKKNDAFDMYLLFVVVFQTEGPKDDAAGSSDVLGPL